MRPVTESPYLNFIDELIEERLEISLQYILDFLKGLSNGLAKDLDDLYLFARLCFIKKTEYLDTFDRVFARYFYDIELPSVAEGDLSILETDEFRNWLNQIWYSGELERPPGMMSTDELIEKFWQTVREQTEEHHGGNKWVGTGGTSPFGHSGFGPEGIRVHGQARNFSAMKVIGERRYVDYSSRRKIDEKSFDEAVSELKHMKPAGAHDRLDIDESIYRTAKNGGEIELIFKQDHIDKLEVILMIDNGGSSMMPYVPVVRKLFAAMTDSLRSIDTYFFHNTIYSHVFKDPQRTRPVPLRKLLKRDRDIRLFIVGDASMAPSELMSAYGSINWHDQEYEPSFHQLQKLRDRFPCSVWLNPILREQWKRSGLTLRKISELFHMEDLTIGGLHSAVEYVNRFQR